MLTPLALAWLSTLSSPRTKHRAVVVEAAPDILLIPCAIEARFSNHFLIGSIMVNDAQE